MIPTRSRGAARTKRGPRRGTVAVELAVVAPLLCLLALGICEVGRAIMVKEILAVAARHGCRTGARPLSENATILADVHNVLANNGINAEDATVTIQVNDQALDAATAKAFDKITVTVSVPFSSVSWLSSFLFVNPETVEAETVTMLRQG